MKTDVVAARRGGAIFVALCFTQFPFQRTHAEDRTWTTIAKFSDGELEVDWNSFYVGYWKDGSRHASIEFQTEALQEEAEIAVEDCKNHGSGELITTTVNPYHRSVSTWYTGGKDIDDILGTALCDATIKHEHEIGQ